MDEGDNTLCGIVGFVTKGDTRQDVLDAIEGALILDVKRGSDACGVTWLTPDNTLKVRKGPGVPDKLLANYELQATPLFIGHNRAKTIGSADDNTNNHPLVSGSYVLVHNGSVSMDSDDKKKLGLEPEAEVDSQLIVQAIRLCAKKGVSTPAAIVEATKYISGTFACALMNGKEPGKVWLFKREYPPMRLMYMPKLSTIFFASDEDYIKESVGEEESLLGGLFTRTKIPQHYVTALSSRDLIEIDLNHNWASYQLPEENKTVAKVWYPGHGSTFRSTFCQKCKTWHEEKEPCTPDLETWNGGEM